MNRRESMKLKKRARRRRRTRGFFMGDWVFELGSKGIKYLTEYGNFSTREVYL